MVRRATCTAAALQSSTTPLAQKSAAPAQYRTPQGAHGRFFRRLNCLSSSLLPPVPRKERALKTVPHRLTKGLVVTGARPWWLRPCRSPQLRAAGMLPAARDARATRLWRVVAPFSSHRWRQRAYSYASQHHRRRQRCGARVLLKKTSQGTMGRRLPCRSNHATSAVLTPHIPKAGDWSSPPRRGAGVDDRGPSA